MSEWEVKLDQNTLPENLDPLKDKNSLTVIERYIFASHWCRGKSVVDASCGYGFGTSLLSALGAKEVVGLDIDDDALKYCQENHKNCTFFKFDLTNPLSIVRKYDVVVSIETMEHLPRDKIDNYISNLKSLVNPDGIIIITTPIRRCKEFVYHGGTHLYEYDVNEFLEIMKSNFVKVNYNSIVEFRLGESGLLHSEFIDFISDKAMLFFAVCKLK